MSVVDAGGEGHIIVAMSVPMLLACPQNFAILIRVAFNLRFPLYLTESWQ
jgi:hypothetical protein